jgi:DNA-binding helix-hairpin-helix protein with protein kinase domain
VEGLIQQGQTLRMERGGAVLTVGKRIGEGGQGVVHLAQLNDTQFAVKWFRPGPGNDEMRKSITALVQRGRPPHHAFVWPIDLVSSDQLPGFGYVMPLLEPRFMSLAELLNQEVQPSFRVVTAIGRELVDAFAALHSAGLCYRDISFGNLRVDPLACEAAIIDVDNVGPDGADAQVKGTGPFMAPEILRDEARPSTVTDLHSLAVLLFYLLMHGHPLLGVRADASYTWERNGHRSETEVLVRNFGLEPLFIFDPNDPSNRPLPGDRVVLWWAIYPQQCRRVFTQAFTAGLRDASLNGRVTEGIWRRALLSLQDCVSSCAACGAALFHDPEQSRQSCWHCAGPLPAPPKLKVPGGTLVLSEGAVVSSHHLNRDRDYRTACAVVESHPGRPGRVVMRNLTDKTWTVVPDGEEPKRVAPSQRLGVRPLIIDFGSVRGQIL